MTSAEAVAMAGAPCALAAVLAQAELRGGEPAVLADARSVTHGELCGMARHMAGHLLAEGIQPGDVVACAAGHDLPSVVAWLAIGLVGAVWMPLDPAYPQARLAAMLEDGRPAAILGDAAGRLSRPAAYAGRWLAHRERLAATAVTAGMPRIPAAGLAYVLFTSGSSGRPKGVAMRRSVIDHLVDWHRAHPRLGRPARTLQFAPLTFDVSLQELYGTLATGGTLVLPSAEQRRDPYALLSRLVQAGIERIFLPYVALQALAEAVAAGGELPVHLRDVITAGEQLRITPAIRALFRVLPDAVLHNHYGPTETHVVTAHALDGDAASWPELPPIGRPLPHVQLQVVDLQGRSVAAGEEGELLLGGDCLAEGYIHRDALTAERFVEYRGARWYRSGDRARIDASGVAWWCGRLDGQLKIDGYRVEPSEIETVLLRHPAVADVAVVADAQTRLVAHVVPRNDGDDTALAESLRAHCHSILAAYLVPQAFVLRSALPLTASGKIDRRTLAGEAELAPLAWPEQAPLEDRLAALWEQLLGLPALPRRANLFDLGARSLTVIRALTELRRRGFRQLRAAQLYEHPTVAAQAALLSGDVAASGSAVASADAGRGERQRAALARFGPRGGARA